MKMCKHFQKYIGVSCAHASVSGVVVERRLLLVHDRNCEQQLSFANVCIGTIGLLCQLPYRYGYVEFDGW